MAAVLFKLEAAVRLGYTSEACTDVACQWNASFVAKVKPARIADIQLGRKEPAASTSTSAAPTPMAGDTVTDEQAEFLQQLGAIAKPVCLSLFDQTCNVFDASQPAAAPIALPPSLRELHHQQFCSLSDDDLRKYIETVDISLAPEEIEFVEQSTVLQASSVSWYEQRAGRITASAVHKILHTDFSKPSKSLILSITSASKKDLNVPSVLHGRNYEPVAIDEFKTQLPDLHRGGEILKCGFRICAKKPWLGASPDSLLRCSCHGNGVIEVKCPYMFRDTELGEMLQDSRCCLDSDGSLKQNHPYYVQLQIQMFVFDVQFGVLLLYAKSLIVLNIERDDAFLESARPLLFDFWLKHIMPELLTRKLECGYGEGNRPVLELYCYCQVPRAPETSPWVKCSGNDCPFRGLVHLACIRPKRKYPPTKSWWCKVCKRSK